MPYICLCASRRLELLLPHDSEAFWQQLRESRISETLESSTGGDDTIGACDEEIAFAQAYLQEFSARRNELLSVIQLPSEILGSILRFLLPALKLQLLHSVSHEDIEGKIAASSRSLIAASQVCRRWRDVALEHSALWTLLWIKNTYWMREMLVRTKATPITIMQPQLSKASNISMESLTSRLFDEIQPKRLYLLPPSTQASVTMLWNKVLVRPAPHLETFEIAGGNEVRYIPDQLFGRSAPALRHLGLSGCFSYEALWSSPILHQLVTFSVDVHHTNIITTKPRVPLQDVLGALRQMRQLKALYFTCPSYYIRSPLEGPPYFTHYEQDYPLVELPRLSSLHLLGSLPEITALARHLVVPRGVTVRYALTIREDRIHDGLAECITKLLHHVIPFSQLKASEITFMGNSDCALHIRCWNLSLPAHTPYLDSLCCGVIISKRRVLRTILNDGVAPNVPSRFLRVQP